MFLKMANVNNGNSSYTNEEVGTIVNSLSTCLDIINRSREPIPAYVELIKPKSPIDIIVRLIESYKGTKVKTTEFHDEVKNRLVEKDDFGSKKVRIVIEGMGYKIYTSNGIRYYILS